MYTEDEVFLTVKQLGDRYGVHHVTVYNWVRKGCFPQPKRFAGLTRWPLSEVIAWESDQPRGVR